MIADRYETSGGHMVEVYETPTGWMWRRVTSNGRVLSESNWRHGRKDSAVRAARRLNPPVAAA